MLLQQKPKAHLDLKKKKKQPFVAYTTEEYLLGTTLKCDVNGGNCLFVVVNFMPIIYEVNTLIFKVKFYLKKGFISCFPLSDVPTFFLYNPKPLLNLTKNEEK